MAERDSQQKGAVAGKADNASGEVQIPKLKDLIKTALTAGNDIEVPPLIRKQFAKKVWTLLSCQLIAMFILACVVDAFFPNVSEERTGHMVFGLSLLFVFLTIALLYFLRDMQPANMIMLGFVIIFQGIFWGLAKYVIGYFAEGYNYSLHFIGITTICVFISAVMCQTGVTEKVASKVMPTYERESRCSRASSMRQSGNVQLQAQAGDAETVGWPAEQQKVVRKSGLSASVHAAQRNSLSANTASRATAVVDYTKLAIKAENDGIMRATMYMAVFGWIFAWCLDIGTLAVMQYSAEVSKVSIKAAAVAGAMAFPLVLFLHIDLIRQMRRHSIDEYMHVIVMVNADMFGFLIGFAILVGVVLIAEGESADGGGGGGGDGGGDDRGGGSGGGGSGGDDRGGGGGGDDERGSGGGSGGDNERGSGGGGEGGGGEGGGGDGQAGPGEDADAAGGAIGQPLGGGGAFDQFGAPTGGEMFWWRLDMPWLAASAGVEDEEAEKKKQQQREAELKQQEEDKKYFEELEKMKEARDNQV